VTPLDERKLELSLEGVMSAVREAGFEVLGEGEEMEKSLRMARRTVTPSTGTACYPLKAIPYLQYAHARLVSMGRKNAHLLPLPPSSQIATHTLAQYPHARNIAFLLGTYPDVVKVALQMHEPRAVTYAFRLAHAISAA